ncbi:MAG: hypothetical protein GKR89_29280 [Candidatus Latescibacteria bacterium]|nr:hypothetical protein [Candidatus Latescibacterota bacterium]
MKLMVPALFLVLLSFPASGQLQSGQHESFTGWWLANGSAEAFVIAQPYPRIVAFRLKGGQSPLHISHDYEYFGIRSWFFEPDRIPESGLPALQPAQMEQTGPLSLHLSGAAEEKSGLRLKMDIALDSKEPVLTVRHGFENMRPEKRRLAAWALNVIDPDNGVGLAPWRSEGRRAFLFWPSTSPDEKGLHLGPKTLALDYRILPQDGWLKVGTNTDAGWVAYVWDGQALKSTVEFVANADYPEDGGTVTFFNSTSERFESGSRFGEIENVGPLCEVLPGNTLWMEQKLELIGGLEGTDPEQWLETLSPSTD